jgi:hypothetical protein
MKINRVNKMYFIIICVTDAVLLAVRTPVGHAVNIGKHKKEAGNDGSFDS